MCYQKLLNLVDPVHHLNALSPKNVLLLALKWLWRYPPEEVLADEFGSIRQTVDNLVKGVLAILDHELAYLRDVGSLRRNRILKGELKGTVMAIDSFPICIPRPHVKDDEKKTKEEQKRFFLYKKDHKTRFAWKVQLCADLNGRIVDVSSARPYGSIADINLLRQSAANNLLGPDVRAVYFPQNAMQKMERRLDRQRKLLRNVERRLDGLPPESKQEEKTKETDEAEAEDEEDEAKEDVEEEVEEDVKEEAKEDLVDRKHAKQELPSMGIGDKAYQGHEYVYVPNKRYKTKRMTAAKRKFNKRIGSMRVIIEHVNKRMEDWKVLGSIYRGGRDAAFVSLIVRVVALLYNLKLEKEPLRRIWAHARR